MKKIIYILTIILFYMPMLYSQGVSNNGAYIKISSVAYVMVTGTKGNFVNGTSGALNGKIQNDGKIYVQGKWLNNSPAGNLFINRNTIGEVILNGTTRQTIDGSQMTYFESLRINNTSATSPQIVLNMNTVIQNQLTMIAGNINLAGFTLTLGITPATSGTLSHTGVAANGWIYGGSFIRYFNTPVVADRNVSAGLFPMGSSTDFRQLYVSHPSVSLTTGGTITLAHTASNTAVGVSFPDGASTVVRRNNSFWTISTGGGIAVTGTPFNLSAEGTSFGSVTNVSDLRLTLVSSVVGTAGTNGGTTIDPQINRTGISLLNLTNNFYPASVKLSSPLTIELISFNAICDGNNNVNIDWATASETNNDFFTVYKSADALSWTEFKSIPGAGNSNEVKNYSVTDNNYNGSITYYRLQQTDFDGTSVWFNAASADCSGSERTTVAFYPNPFKMYATVVITDASQMNNYELKIYNVLGKEVMNMNITNQTTAFETGNLPSGTYYYKVTGNGKTIQTGKLISIQ